MSNRSGSSPNVVSANDPEVIVKLRITLRQGKIKLARIRAFGHLENAKEEEEEEANLCVTQIGPY